MLDRLLEGIRIIDFSTGRFGGYATMLLADFGADVIKVENIKTNGDVLRERAPKNDNGSASHAYFNRGKKSVCLDYQSSEGKKIVYELVRNADVVVDSFAAGYMEKLGYGYDELTKVNPKIVVASNTAFGKTGELSYTSGSDIAAQAASGLMDITHHDNMPPSVHGSRIAQQFGNLFFAMSIIGAILARDETGEGQQIDVSACDCMITALEIALFAEKCTGVIFENEGNASRAIAPYDTFRVKGGYVSTAVSTNAQWEKFCNVMGFPQYIDDPRFNTNETRGKNYTSLLRPIIDDSFKDMTRQEIEDKLRPLNIPSGPNLTVEEAIHSDQIVHRNMVVEMSDKTVGRIKMPGKAIKMSDVSDIPVVSAPLLGEHTKELLQAEGYNEEQLQDMADAGIIFMGRAEI